jgi:hypothetical protein
MFNYGSRNYGQGLYGGLDTPFATNSIPVSIEVYTTLGDRKGTFQLGCGYFISCSFSHNKNGCVSFNLEFSKIVNLDKKDIIKIKLFNSLECFFTGVIRKVPIEGSTENKYDYSGSGLVDYLGRLNAGSLNYANKTIAYILDDLLDTVIIPNSPISYNVAKVVPPAITLISFVINYSNINDVITTLTDIANSTGLYYSGVDKDGDFFFLPESDEVKKTLIVGAKGTNGIDNYNPKDINEPRTKYYVLDKDGVYVSTITSSEDNDIYEEKLTAPDIDNTSIDNWAAGTLAGSEQLIRNASINWKIEETDPLCLVADGYIRILSSIPPTTITPPTDSLFGAGLFGAGLFGGEQYTGYNLDDTLRVMEIGYSINNDGAMRSIQLGSIPIRLDEEFYSIKKDLTDLRISLGR